MILTIDLESELIGPLSTGHPRFVVGGWKYRDGRCFHTDDMATYKGRIAMAASEGYTIVGHNIAFDLGVLGFSAMDIQGWKIHDTGMQDLLHRLATDDCARNKPGPPMMKKLSALTKIRLKGKGTTQLSFKPGVPLTDEQIEYLYEDVEATYGVYLRQKKAQRISEKQILLQVQANMALTQLSHTGIRVDRGEIGKQRVVYTKAKRDAARILQVAGIYQPAWQGLRGGKHKASCKQAPFKDHVLRLYAANELTPEYTEKENLKIDRNTLRELPNDTLVEAWLEYKGSEKIISTFLNAWDVPSCRIHPRFMSPMRTGRTSSSQPNFQNIPRKGSLKRVFLPEEGRKLYEIDFNQLELCCLAQITQGLMRKKINAGDDLHTYLAAVFLNKPEAEVTKEERQLAKQANFGYPGGMGPAKFRKLCRGAGMDDPGDLVARELKNAWLHAYPEMARWLEDDSMIPPHLSQVVAGRKEGTEWHWDQIRDLLQDSRIPAGVRDALWDEKASYFAERWLAGREVIVNGRKRYPVSYTEAHNCKFQGLAADLTKAALIKITSLPEVTCHAFIHDSYLVSAANDGVAQRVVRVMLDTAKQYLPTVRVGASLEGPGENWWDAKQKGERNFYNRD